MMAHSSLLASHLDFQQYSLWELDNQVFHFGSWPWEVEGWVSQLCMKQ